MSRFLVTACIPALDENLIAHAIHAIETGLLTEKEAKEAIADEIIGRCHFDVEEFEDGD